MRRLVLLFAGSFAAFRITRGAKPPPSGGGACEAGGRGLAPLSGELSAKLTEGSAEVTDLPRFFSLHFLKTAVLQGVPAAWRFHRKFQRIFFNGVMARYASRPASLRHSSMIWRPMGSRSSVRNSCTCSLKKSVRIFAPAS